MPIPRGAAHTSPTDDGTAAHERDRQKHAWGPDHHCYPASVNPLVPTEVDVILSATAIVFGAAVTASVIVLATWLSATGRVKVWSRTSTAPGTTARR